MKRLNQFAILSLLLLWSGCKITNDLALPRGIVPETFRNADSKDSSSIGERTLRNFIMDLTVQNLIDTALKHNYDLQIAIKNIEGAELLFKQSKLGYLPELKTQISASTTRPSDNSLNGLNISQFTDSKHVEDYNGSLTLFWEADIWGKIRSQKEASRGSFLQTEFAKRAVQTRVVSNVAQGFYNLLMLDAQLEIAKKNIALSDSTLIISKLQFDAGQITSLAVQQAQSQRFLAQQLLPKIEQAIILQENALSILVGKTPASISRTTKLEEMSIPQELNTGFPSSMLSRRPDIKTAELALTIANAKVGIAKAGMYPTLTITGTGGVNAFKASKWFNIPSSLFGMVSGGITQPIFQKGQLRTNYEVAKIDREKSVIQFRQSILNAVGEVSDELTKFEKLASQYGLAEKRTNTLKQASNNATLLFKSGMANYLEVIIAQGNLLQSELELATIKNQQLNAVIGLYRSLGGGWQ